MRSPRIDLQFLDTDDEHRLCAELYWARSDGSHWDHSVSEVARLLGVSASKVPKLVAQWCVARSPMLRCPVCHEMAILECRARLGLEPALCRRCSTAKWEEADRLDARAHEIRRDEDARKKRALESLREQRARALGDAVLDLRAAVALCALFDGSASATKSPFAGTSSFALALVRHLDSKGLIVPAPSALDRIVIRSDGSLSYSFSPLLPWEIPLPPDAPTAAAFLQSVAARLAGLWSPDWRGDSPQFHRAIALDDCLAYASHSLRLHRVDYWDESVAKGVVSAAFEHLTHGQTRTLAWNAIINSIGAQRRYDLSGEEVFVRFLKRMREVATGRAWDTYARDKRSPAESRVSQVYWQAKSVTDSGFSLHVPEHSDLR